MSYKKELLKLAEQGDVEAQHDLALSYYVALFPSNKKAVYWWEKAARQGHVDAQYYLGSCYLCGKGVKADFEVAKSWFISAARNGQEDAKKILERMEVEY